MSSCACSSSSCCCCCCCFWAESRGDERRGDGDEAAAASIWPPKPGVRWMRLSEPPLAKVWVHCRERPAAGVRIAPWGSAVAGAGARGAGKSAWAARKQILAAVRAPTHAMHAPGSSGAGEAAAADRDRPPRSRDDRRTLWGGKNSGRRCAASEMGEEDRVGR